MTFDFNDYFTIGKEIGRGAYGTVFIATIKKPYPPLQPGSHVAIKSISTSRITSIQEKEKLENEISLMSKLDHPNIVKLYGVEKTSSHYFLILEYCNGGDLFQYMKSLKKSPKEKTTSHISTTNNYEIIDLPNSLSSEETIRDYASQIASGLFYLHSHQIVHRDLKPHNILISKIKSPNHHQEKLTLKIADFGFARFLKPSDLATTVCGSPVYMAPEIQFGSQYSSNVDMWSLGIILYELITGQTPFPKVKTQYELAMELKHKGSNFYSLPSSTKASPELRNLIEKLLTINPVNRMTCSEFLNDPFIGISKNAKSEVPPKKSEVPPKKNEIARNLNSKKSKNDDIIIDEDFDFEIISSTSFNPTTSSSKSKGDDQKSIQKTAKIISSVPKKSTQIDYRKPVQKDDQFKSSDVFSIDSDYDINLSYLSSETESLSLVELSESFKEKQKFSFIATIPDVGIDQAEEYLTEAFTSADTIMSHFTECQNISNELLINTEILVIRFLFDFLVEERHLAQISSKDENGAGKLRTRKEKERKNTRLSIEKEVCELIKLCIREVSALIDATEAAKCAEQKESDLSLISSPKTAVPPQSSLQPSLQPSSSLKPSLSSANKLVIDNQASQPPPLSPTPSLPLSPSGSRKITINFVSYPKSRCVKKKQSNNGMQFLFNKALEYAKDAAKLEISKQFEFASLKYKRALYILQPIAFSKNSNEQIIAARELYKKIYDRFKGLRE